MSKSIKFNNNVYLDCSGVIYRMANGNHWHLGNIIGSIYKEHGAYDHENATKTRNLYLSSFGVYLLTVADVGDSSIYSCGSYIIICGANSEKTSRIYNIGGMNQTNFKVEFVNGTQILVTYPTIYHVTTLNRLSLY